MPEYSEYPAFSDPYFLIYEDIPTGQKMKFSIKDFFSKCDQSHRNLRIWSNFLKKSLMESFIFCAVTVPPLNKKIWVRGKLYSGIFYAMIYEPDKIQFSAVSTWRRTLKSEIIFDNWKSFKNDEKCFLFHFKSYSRYQDILIFVLSFWSSRKTIGLVR